MMPLLVLLTFFVALFLVFTVLLHYRAKKLARVRRGTGFEDFVLSFAGEQIPRDKLFVVYEYLGETLSIKDFPVYATDDLCKVYGICEEDLDSIVIDLAEKWRVVIPAGFQTVDPVNTVADLVRLLAGLPYGKDDTPI